MSTCTLTPPADALPVGAPFFLDPDNGELYMLACVETGSQDEQRYALVTIPDGLTWSGSKHKADALADARKDLVQVEPGTKVEFVVGRPL